ncbi:zinc finger protein ZAT7-like [Daucus carota subsp. sativus]|uniref:zinc finger protein ZAT7-like n=1 Tax=Daucus carota subsp. sativus TaxID=79200 RepID=UPI003082A9D3
MRTKFSNTDAVERFAMANCAMIAESRKSSSQPEEIFKCKTCKLSFATSQSLGGHCRASHYKRLELGGGETEAEKKGPKPYKCTVCGAEFWNGQALGGHKGKHRKPKIQGLLGSNESLCNNASTVTSSAAPSDDVKMVTAGNFFDKGMLGLDLNLSPEENEMKVFEIN